MRRHLPRLLLLGALLSPATLYALGLGEIRLNSALNQPFDADIEVIAPTKEELADLKVALASNELFARYGLDRPAYLSNFDFAVSRGREVILPLLFLPLAIPLVVGGVGAGISPQGSTYLSFLGLYDLVFAILAWATFEYVVTE